MVTKSRLIDDDGIIICLFSDVHETVIVPSACCMHFQLQHTGSLIALQACIALSTSTISDCSYISTTPTQQLQISAIEYKSKQSDCLFKRGVAVCTSGIED